MTHKRTWPAFIVVGWLAILAISVWHANMPASSWFDVSKVYVFDSVEGETPGMIADRTIRKSFHAQWVVTVYRKGARGFFPYCVSTGTNSYDVDDVLPDRLDLDFWTWPVRCQLPEGQYQVRTRWIINPVGYAMREVRANSNIFTVRPKIQPGAH